ncbi:MAG: transporter substrate-binding domain-containing protein [Eubacteriales bacterium]|jgi:polar amino acid transport system substrate-binding protein|nr:transporter substrate-binding domain-containing protein [Eubacteriales bacterium]
MKKSTSRILIIALTLILIFSFAGCGGPQEEDEPQAPANRLEEILARGYIEVIMEPYFAPFEFIDPAKSGDEQYVGCDVEIAKAIAEDLDVELRIIPLEFSAVLAGITEGKYDLAISALSYTPARAENMEMSDGYYISEAGDGYGMLIREEDLAKYTDAASFAEAVLVAQSGSIQEMFINTQIPEYKELKLVSASTDGYLMVSEGKADAAAVAIETAKLYATANPGVTVAEDFRFEEDGTTNSTRIGIPKGESELTEKVNEIIAKLMDEGKIIEWYNQYAEYASTLGI